VDVTACPIYKPPNQELYYSVKHKRHVLKFEVVINLVDSIIVWVSGGYPGSVHDLTIARMKLTSMIIPNERLLADKGYIGDDVFLTPVRTPTTPAQRQWNHEVSKCQSKIEKINGRIKDFGLFRNQFKGSNYQLYSEIFIIVCQLINLEKMV
jgi:hypothetical protein